MLSAQRKQEPKTLQNPRASVALVPEHRVFGHNIARQCSVSRGFPNRPLARMLGIRQSVVPASRALRVG